ncbi:hypothetical protein, partial [Vibrio parahaemolyticus]|uniref:hypothetical protein n=1 Tax=Vibrio parahaemolyticus TaxID=670 RepID=UPI001E35A840
TPSGCCERCSLHQWSERNGGSSTGYCMILHTPHLTIARKRFFVKKVVNPLVLLASLMIHKNKN